MSTSEAARLSNYAIPPRAGQGAVVAVSAVASSFDLRTVGNQTVNTAQGNQLKVGLPGKWVRLFADGADVYVITGATQGAVTGGNAPVTGATAANGAGASFKIPNNTELHVYCDYGVDLWLGIIASGAGFLRIFPATN